MLESRNRAKANVKSALISLITQVNQYNCYKVKGSQTKPEGTIPFPNKTFTPCPYLPLLFLSKIVLCITVVRSNHKWDLNKSHL